MKKLGIVILVLTIGNLIFGDRKDEVEDEGPTLTSECEEALEYGSESGLILAEQVEEYERLIEECTGNETEVYDPVPIYEADHYTTTTRFIYPPGQYPDGSAPVGSVDHVGEEDEAFFECQEEGFGEEYCLEYYEDYLDEPNVSG